MKYRLLVSIATVACVSVATYLVFAESATYGWQAKQVERHPHIQKLRMVSPLRGDHPPKNDVFEGHFSSWPQHKAKLEKIHILSLDKAGAIKLSEVQFKMLNTVEAKDKKLVVTHFKTDAVEYEDGKVMILVFKAEGKRSLLSVRMSRWFIPH